MAYSHVPPAASRPTFTQRGRPPSANLSQTVSLTPGRTRGWPSATARWQTRPFATTATRALLKVSEDAADLAARCQSASGRHRAVICRRAAYLVLLGPHAGPVLWF